MRGVKRGCGVERGFGVGAHLPMHGVAVGVRVGVGVAVAVGVAVGVGVGVGDAQGTSPIKLPNAIGPVPTATVSITVLSEVSITQTLLPTSDGTYTRVPSGFTATPYGLLPTATVATTVLLEVSITRTVPSGRFVT